MHLEQKQTYLCPEAYPISIYAEIFHDNLHQSFIMSISIALHIFTPTMPHPGSHSDARQSYHQTPTMLSPQASPQPSGVVAVHRAKSRESE